MEWIPNFILYGEKDREIFPDYLHMESIRARSLRHGWTFRPHRHHSLYQFFLVNKGAGRALIEGADYPLHNNQIIVMPPMAVHGFDFQPDTEGWVLTVPAPFLHRILEEEPALLDYLAEARALHCEDKETGEDFARLFADIAREHAGGESLRGLGVRSLITRLAVTLFRHFPRPEENRTGPSGQKQPFLRNFLTLVDEHFRERWPVSRYADTLGITPTHLSRLCRQVLNMPASALVTERSLLEARRLLIYTSLSISEIAWELGFTDPAHFSKFFREKAGRQPSEFRRDYTRRA